MKLKLITPILIVTASLAGYAMTATAQNPGHREDAVAIRDVIVEMTEGFNKHDAVAASVRERASHMARCGVPKHVGEAIWDPVGTPS